MREWKIGRESGSAPARDPRPTRDAPFFRGFDVAPVSGTQERYGFRLGSSRPAKDVRACFSAGLSDGGAARAIMNACHGSQVILKKAPTTGERLVGKGKRALRHETPQRSSGWYGFKGKCAFASGLNPRSRFGVRGYRTSGVASFRV